MIFLDTSGIYAVLDRDDEHHAKASECWAKLLDSREQLVTTNYILLESCGLAQYRLGVDAVRAIEEEIVPILRVEWVDQEVHTLAIAALLAARRKKLSLVDCTSFAVMRRNGLRKALAFDRHFDEQGFGFPD